VKLPVGGSQKADTDWTLAVYAGYTILRGERDCFKLGRMLADA
jgi:hypothetical protein